MVTISGTCRHNGEGVQGATVWVVNPENPSVVATAESGADGTWSAEVPEGHTVHIVSQFEDDSGKKYNAKGYPFVDIEAPPWIDNFDGQDLVEYSGDTGAFAFTQDPATQGSYALQTDFSPSAYNQILSSPGDGLDNYMGKGDDARAYVRSTRASGSEIFRQEIGYGAEGTGDNHYYIAIRWDASGDNIFLRRVQGGGISDLASAHFDRSAGTWFRLEWVWDDGSQGGQENEHRVQLYQRESDTPEATLGPVVDDSHDGNEGVMVAARKNATGDMFWDGWSVNP